MNQGISLIVYPVKDLAKAKALFSQFLGVQPYVDGAYYVGYRVGDQEVRIDRVIRRDVVERVAGHRTHGDAVDQDRADRESRIRHDGEVQAIAER